VSHREWVSLKDLNARGRYKGGETKTMGLMKTQVRVSKEMVKTSHGPLECLRATKCRQKGGSIRE